jgi:glycosyltransferase involved in cell wall biosynthesis
MQASPVLSIVVPVYNVEPFLPAFLGSVLPQLDTNCECIFVDDGSTDRSVAVLEEELRQWNRPNWRLLRHDKNRGLSAARNTGIAEARGEYTWFLDSDDVMMSGAVAKVIGVLATGKPDLVVVDFARMWEKKTALVVRGERGMQFTPTTAYDFDFDDGLRAFAPNAVTRDRTAVSLMIFLNTRFYAWIYVARTELARRLPFPEGKYFEDMSVIPLWLLQAESVHYLHEVLVGYRQRAGSILATHSAAKFLDCARGFRPVIRYYDKVAPSRSQAEFEFLCGAWVRLVFWALRDATIHGYLRNVDTRSAFAEIVADCRTVLGTRKDSIVEMIRREASAAEARHLRILLWSFSLYLTLLRLRLSRVGRVAAAIARM